MKNVRLILIMIMVLCGASIALGQPVVFTPGVAQVRVPAGASDSVPVTVSATSPGSYFVVYAQQVQGTVPPSWVVASPQAGFGLPAYPVLNVNVPEGTPPGTYRSTILSYVSGTQGGGSVVPGMTLEVVVPAAAPLCDKEPGFDLSVSGDSAIWAAMKSTQDVVITGHVVLGEGCELDGPVSWTVNDEYGDHEPSGEVTTGDDLTFEVSVPVEVFRKGSDKNGRLYQVTFEATTANGLTGVSQPPVSIVITHDRSEGK